MVHKFDVSQRSKLDNPERRRLLPPDETLKKLGLKTGETIADIGCGIGYFTIPAARIVGPSGRVYALDISDEMLVQVHEGKKSNNLTNIETVKTTEYDLKLESGLISFGFICNVLHEIDEFSRFVDEIKRLLKDQGTFALIEWEKKVSSTGPPIEHRIDKESMITRLIEQGFKLIDCQNISEEYYSLIMEKR